MKNKEEKEQPRQKTFNSGSLWPIQQKKENLEPHSKFLMTHCTHHRGRAAQMRPKRCKKCLIFQRCIVVGLDDKKTSSDEGESRARAELARKRSVGEAKVSSFAK